MKTFTYALILGVMSFWTAQAGYLRVEPVAAYASSAYDTQRVPMNVINGSGLGADGTHSTGRGGLWMGANSGPTWFLVDFGEVRKVDRVKVWNFNMEGYQSRGVRQVDFLMSESDAIDPLVTPDFADSSVWSEVATDIEIAQATGAAGDPGAEPIVLAHGGLGRWFAIRVDSDWGGGYRGLSELQFFRALGGVASVTQVTEVSATSMAFEAALSLEGESEAAMVAAVLGAESAGDRLEAWDRVVWLGEKEGGAFSSVVTGLSPDAGYVLRLAVEDGHGGYSLGDEMSFMTGVVSVEAPGDFMENDKGLKAITFVRPASCVGVEVPFSYEVSGDAAADYAEVLTGTGVFAVGEESVVVHVQPVNNVEEESDRGVTISVLPGEGYLVGGGSSASFMVLDAGRASGTYVWTGLGTGMSWREMANWSPEGVPTYVDVVRIESLASTNEPVLADGSNAAGRLFVGEAAGTVGALLVPEGKGLSVQSETVIGGQGQGALVAERDSVLTFNVHPVYVGKNAGGEGSLRLEGAMTLSGGRNLVVGDGGVGELHVGPEASIEVGISGQSGHTYIGNSATGEGTMYVNGGSVSVGYAGVIGNKGKGFLYMDGGLVRSPSKFGLRVGGSAGGSGFVEVRGNGTYSCTSSSYNQIGYAGTGVVHCIQGVVEGRGISIGDQVGSSGLLIVEEEGHFNTGTTGYNLFVGNNGDGELRLRGGSGTYSKNGNLVIRNAPRVKGVLSGWGTISSGSSASIRNNGIVCADGEGEERKLVLSSTTSSFQNDVENDGTNGWYAVRGGCLEMRNSSSFAAGASGVYTWGESAADEEMDLVNSLRLGLTNVTAKVTRVTGELLDPARSDVPALPSGAEAIGCWRMTLDGAFESVDVEVRYDAVAAKDGAVRLARYDAEAGAWQWLDTRELPGERVVVRGLLPKGSEKAGLFVAISSPRPTVLMLR